MRLTTSSDRIRPPNEKLTICDRLHTCRARLPIYFLIERWPMQPGRFEGRIMRNAMPMRWIEQAESRRVLTNALSEFKPTPPRPSLVEDAASQLLLQLRSWIAARHPMVGWFPRHRLIDPPPDLSRQLFT
jgi:hypothetical protein